ncbi:hypothetical protein F945_02127 [Acinetobacter rudis CIP 110305]|uniref:DUF2158 domain-containing protein n=1 Tax=Acinetobacter rudis CIP 110305 TaxID=421052 RepID=S3MZJ9_9GAMM|nr:hypothetical protein F945_02127 [Acinetobacter rudis CIP 110305]
MTLEVGSVVVFVLGSPEMIVYSMSDTKVKCKWFCTQGRLHRSSFNGRELIPTGQKFTIDQPKLKLVDEIIRS